ncbi:MAG: NUDIX domain-containing protein [Gammaproteobacteria bacterium]|nr:NUDIX domain-containing protein [Gammaproteobacteria bacterium]
MAFQDTFRLSSHAVITNNSGEVLLLKANYGDGNWGLPGGALEPNETIHEALLRECEEEIKCQINIQYLSGVYFHSAYNSQSFIFRCDIKNGCEIQLSDEHTDYKYSPVETMSPVQKHRIKECLAFNGYVASAKF